MALIFADDFLQLKPWISGYTGAAIDYATGARISDTLASYGYAPPAVAQPNSLVTYVSVAGFDAAMNALTIYCGNRGNGSTIIYGETRELVRRGIKYSGDTFYASFVIELHESLATAPAAYIIRLGEDYAVLGIAANRKLTFNCVETDVDAIVPTYYAKHRIEFELTPTHANLYIGGVMKASVQQPHIPITSFKVGLPNGNNWYGFMNLYSVILADNSGDSFNTRIGRKVARSFPIANVASIDTTPNFSPVNTTAATVLAAPMGVRNGENVGAGYGYGCYQSPDPYKKTVLTSVKDDKPAFAACVHLQMKRSQPVGDEMTAIPYITIGGTRYDLVGKRPGVLWNTFAHPVDFATPQLATNYEFGYTYDFLDENKVFVDDRVKTEVYGQAPAQYVMQGYTDNVPTFAKTATEKLTYKENITMYSQFSTFDKTDIENMSYQQDQ